MIRLRRASRSWREAAFAVLDFEATGLDLARDHVVSYGLVPVERGRACVGQALYRVVRPPVPPSPESIRVHGILPVELQDAVRLDDVAPELFSALEGRTLVAHAAWVELGFLEALYRRHGLRGSRKAIDVIDLAARIREDRPARPSPAGLADLARAHGVPVTRTHHALSDALLTAQLFLVLATRLESTGRGSVRDLMRSGRPQIARSSRIRPLVRTGPVA